MNGWNSGMQDSSDWNATTGRRATTGNWNERARRVDEREQTKHIDIADGDEGNSGREGKS